MKKISLLVISVIIKIFTLNAIGIDSIDTQIIGKNLAVKNSYFSFELKDIIYSELGSIITKGVNGFFLNYDYSASTVKSTVYFHFSVNNNVIIMNKLVQLYLDDKTGVSFGWITLFNDSLNNNKINRDALESLTSFCDYDIHNIINNNYKIKITHKNQNPYILNISLVDDLKNRTYVLPVFYKDGTLIGTSTFIFEQNSWYSAYSSFTPSFFESNFKIQFSSNGITDVQKYNNIGYYLEQSGAYEEAVIILEKVIEKFPTRTVAFINLGDAYWGLKNCVKAKEAYNKYINLMKTASKEAKIPKRVLERVK